MKILNLVVMLFMFVIVSCSTTGKFKVPTGSKLIVEGKPLTEEQTKEYKRAPFFWNASKGIPYMIEKEGKIIDKGNIKSQFRVVSIFWPPFAIIYWPLGFSKEEYDFTSKYDIKVRPEANYVEVPHRK
ncbi:MAG: hypothetical protein H0V66_09010 [Bdellovibrionales bacterium]|nr:hypothetical protein [Bdellovibrionales bacterium]